MKFKPQTIATQALLILIIATFSLSTTNKWGFFGHRRIGRLAVFTLPSDMIGFYKKNIEFITEHSVDPDKRRYAVKGEDIKHYIDIDHWGTYPFDNVPRNYIDALVKFSTVEVILENNDTLLLNNIGKEIGDDRPYITLTDSINSITHQLDYYTYRNFFRNNTQRYQAITEWNVVPDSLSKLMNFNQGISQVYIIDHFSEYGINPYYLEIMLSRLTKAFENKQTARILSLSADFGHYIADAHVPLHTTENYNGQMTDQIGIHAFWESRLPELFADDTYDYFVGKAEYIDHPKEYFWNIIMESHAKLDSVLMLEKKISHSFPKDQQFCFEERLDLIVKTQCKAYAAEYHRQLNGMVERRMRTTIQAVGSLWYTAWVNAGQPNLLNMESIESDLEFAKEQEELNEKYKGGSIKGRAHSNH